MDMEKNPQRTKLSFAFILLFIFCFAYFYGVLIITGLVAIFRVGNWIGSYSNHSGLPTFLITALGVIAFFGLVLFIKSRTTQREPNYRRLEAWITKRIKPGKNQLFKEYDLRILYDSELSKRKNKRELDGFKAYIEKGIYLKKSDNKN